MDRRNKAKSPQEVFALCREREIKAVDLRFTDLLGRLHHKTIPTTQLNEQAFEDGFGFDGSSIRCWRDVEHSDMMLLPQTDSAWIDPFMTPTTLALTCCVQDPVTREAYGRDPRYIASRAENYLSSTGIADVAYFGPETEFFIFDQVSFDQTARGSGYQIDSSEASWNRGAENSVNLGNTIRFREGYAPCPPYDQTADLRGEMMQTMLDCGIEVEGHNHEVATAGQAEIVIKYDTLVACADTVMAFKHIVRNVARRHGKTVTFMPKPIWGDNGSGMHVHFSMWKSGEPLFAGSGHAGLSEIALHAIGGILKHAPALMAFTNPTTNSYKRLVPGFEAPVFLAYSQSNRSAACRIPTTSNSPKSRRVEFRCPDPTCNPYLSFAAILMAAIDGVQNKIHPGDAVTKNLYQLTSAEASELAHVPRRLEAALASLEADHEFLLRGDVFSEDTLRTWVSYKRQYEIKEMETRPHPFEFCMYYDA